MNIKQKLLCSYILLIMFSTLLFGFIIVSKSHEALSSNIKDKNQKISDLLLDIVKTRNDLLFEKVATDLKYASDILYDYGEVQPISYSSHTDGDKDGGSIYIGDTNLSSFDSYIDKVESVTGSACTIFQYSNEVLTRISTNVIDSDGLSAEGSILSSDHKVTKDISSGFTSYGRIKLGTEWYIAGYLPLKDSHGNIVGALGVGHKQLNDYLKDVINKITIGSNGYVYIMDSNGEVILHPYAQGENLSGYSFTQEILKKENGTQIYTFGGKKKLASFTFYKKWDWYIISTANFEDINEPSIVLIMTTCLIGLFVLAIGFIISSILADTIVSPIRDLKYCMESFSKGNRDIHHSSTSADEIGVLSMTFNNLVIENNKLMTEIKKQNKIKSEFFSNVSHELKTPLNIISTANQLLELKLSINDDSNTDEYKSLTMNIRQNSYRLLKLVNNLIDIPRLDSGNLQITLLNVNIIEVIESITMSTVSYVYSKERELIFDTDTEEKIMAVDPDLMERIMLNLISNATKFTSPGDSIFVTVKNRGSYVEISVRDTGIGIEKDKQKIIFERFRQVDKLLNRNHEGSGIGLSLVKSIVSLHGGEIKLTSTPGEGSEFIVVLPVKILEDSDIINYSQFSSPEDKNEQTNIEFSDIY